MSQLDDYAVNKLNLGEPSHERLHASLSNFELKWQNKMRKSGSQTDRISRM